MPRKGKRSKSKSRSAKEDAEADDAYLRREQERDAELLAASLYDAELSQHHQDEACARAAYLRRQLEQIEGPSDSGFQARGRARRGRAQAPPPARHGATARGRRRRASPQSLATARRQTPPSRLR